MNGLETWRKSAEAFGDSKLTLGKKNSFSIRYDIKNLGFNFARYKFCSKMIDNYRDISVLELGCNEGLGTLFSDKPEAVRLAKNLGRRL